jgi:hypothetical protein
MLIFIKRNQCHTCKFALKSAIARRPVARTAPVLQQIGGLMQQMAERIKAGPLTPDQTLQLSTMLEQVATMMSKLGSGTRGADTATQLDGMRMRLTEIQKALVVLMSAPPAKP